jgi:thiol-disulfide isomerase/thioredoxin
VLGQGRSDTVKTIKRYSSRGKLDTNRVVYDESGKALRYYQYVKLLNSGEYTVSIKGAAGDPQAKHYLVKMTPQEQLERAERVRTSMTAKSPLLKAGMKLNLLPFFEVFQKEELDRKVKVLVFWRPDCPPCTDSFESLNEIFKQVYNPDEVIVLAVTPSSFNEASQKLKEKPLLYAKLISSASSVLAAYQLTSYPTLVIADKNDVIQFSSSGLGPQVIATFKNHLRSLLGQ